MKMPVPLQHLFSCPIDALVAALPAADDPVWDVFAVRQNRFRSAQGNTRSIAVAWSEGWDGYVEPTVLWPDYTPPELRRAAADCAERIRAHYGGGTILRLLIAELAPRSGISPHYDTGIGLETTHRCHVPLVTNAGVTFYLDNTGYHLPAGEAYEVDNMRRHGVRNDGDARRIHLICNLLPRDYAPPDAQRTA